MTRVLLLLPTGTYRAPDFLAAAARLDVEVVVGSEHRQALSGSMGDRAVVVPLAEVDAAVGAIEDLHRRSPIDAVVAVDDQGVVVAAAAASRLGIRHNPPDAVGATRDKSVMRRRLDAASLPQPAYRIVPPGGDAVTAAAEIGYPAVVKPVSRAASQGVIRVDDASQAAAAAERIRDLDPDCPETLVVERFVPGVEVAVEGLLTAGRLDVLAVFDKPDPLDGPFFEETIYVTPSGQPPAVLARIAATTGRAAVAMGLTEGPVHAELRIGADDAAGADGTGGADGADGVGTVVTILELAARSIGGLCARTLRFGAGTSLEEVILHHALGLGIDGLVREAQASGVMMLPIRAAGTLEQVSGQERARAVEGIVGLEITIRPGSPVVPLPDGDRYLGFLFARGPDPQAVEASLREAERCLQVHIRGSSSIGLPHHGR